MRCNMRVFTNRSLCGFIDAVLCRALWGALCFGVPLTGWASDQVLTAEDVTIIMQLEADTSLDSIATTILDYSGLIDVGAVMQYQGEYDIESLGAGAYSGTFTGQLTGNYLSDPYTLTYSATFSGDDIAYVVTSSGTWATNANVPPDLRGKPFTDSGTLTNSTNGLKGTIIITTPGVSDTNTINVIITISPPSTTNGTNFILTGKSGEEDVEITIDIVTHKMTSTVMSRATNNLTYSLVLTNTGSYTKSNTVSGHTTGSLSFTLTVEPPRPTFAIKAFSLRGTNTIMTAIGPPGTNCWILNSTNVLTPLANWTVLATNTFGSDGSFSLTNGIAPDCREQFYLLGVPSR